MQTITVTDGNLFDIANRWLGDATQWDAIAASSGITDPWLTGLVTLTIPNNNSTAGVGLVSN